MMLKFIWLILALTVTNAFADEQLHETVDFYINKDNGCYYYRFDNGFCERYIIACEEQVIRQENCNDDCVCETFVLRKKK